MTMDAVLKQVAVITETFEKANIEIERFRALAEDFGIDWRKDMNADRLIGALTKPSAKEKSGPIPSVKKEETEKVLPGMSTSKS